MPWPRGQQVISVEGKFSEILVALPKAAAGCAQPQARGYLGQGVTASLTPLLSDTRFAEQGENGLYPLSRLWKTHAAKDAYVAEGRARHSRRQVQLLTVPLALAASGPFLHAHRMRRGRRRTRRSTSQVYLPALETSSLQ